MWRLQILPARAKQADLDDPLARQLESGCAALPLSPGPREQALLLAYLQLLAKWNGAYNLTAVRDPAQMVTRHLLDSLVIAPYLSGKYLLDVGTGAGLPGVPMAIMFPERKFDLLDSNGKKARFLFQVKTGLCLDNMQVHHHRVESFQPQGLYDGVLSRAFASLVDMVSCCRHLLAPGGCFFAMKGVYPDEELEAVAALCDVRAIHMLEVPGLHEQRHLVEMTPR
jgi:16S rRNA (guanine527-N7)-methyltransferase